MEIFFDGGNVLHSDIELIRPSPLKRLGSLMKMVIRLG